MKRKHSMKRKHTMNKSRKLDNCDIISSLPDEICSHIVSFLPTEQAVATSILSRRWRLVWTFSPSLDFDSSLFSRGRSKQEFAEFVDRTIELHQGSELRRFRLSLNGYHKHEHRPEGWIRYAVSHRVQELYLHSRTGALHKLPGCIFTCESIKVLKLQSYGYLSELPPPTGLRNLKILHITSIKLLKGKFFDELLPNCLLLEDLIIEKCSMDALDIQALKLKSLTISCCSWCDTVQIKVSAPCLKSFNYIGRMAYDHCLENLSSLTEVVLDLAFDKYDSDVCQLYLIKLLQMLGNARALTLSSWCAKHLSRAPNLSKCLQAQGYQLRHLELLVEYDSDIVQTIAPLLISCSNLESVIVRIMPLQLLQRRPTNGGQQLEQHTVDMLSLLKIVKLEYVDKSDTGLELVKFLLKNARALERMSIVLFKDGVERVMFKRELSKFERASPNVHINYYKTI